jgi:uncharacterized protein
VESLYKHVAIKQSIPVVIIGAGPSGLAAAQSLLSAGIEFILVDQGFEVNNRERNNPQDIVEGVGGSGLFSDGKFSFYPASTNLWKITPYPYLQDAYRWLMQILCNHGANLVSLTFPELRHISAPPSNSKDHIIHKLYDSIKLDLSQRMALINSLWNPISSRALLGFRLVGFAIQSRPPGTIILEIKNQNCTRYLDCKHLLIAAGRYSPQFLRNILPRNLMVFRRWEYGIRIEQSSTSFFLNSFDQIDPKLIIPQNDNHPEYRTFCCCRDGEIVATRSNGLFSISGRSNGVPTSKSNVGFLLRSTDKILDKDFMDFLDKSSFLSQVIVFPFEKMELGSIDAKISINTVVSIFGETMAWPLINGLKLLLSKYPSLNQKDTMLYMPAIEGLGYYPAISPELRIPNTNVWVSGDSCGLFRGLTAAFISGWTAGKNISYAIENDHE